MKRKLSKLKRTPPFILNWLSYDKNYDVRYWVALIPNTPQYIKDLYKFRQFLNWYKVPTDNPIKELS